METRYALSHDIRASRLARGLSQADVARRAGRSQPRISELESARGDPRLSTLFAVAAALELEVFLLPRQRSAEVRRLLDLPPRSAPSLTVFDELFVPEEPELGDESGDGPRDESGGESGDEP